MRANVVAGVFAVAAVVVTVAILLLAPPEREATSLARFLVQLLPFFLAAEALSRFTVPPSAARTAAFVLVPFSFLVFFCYFIPRGFYLTDDFERFYVNTLQMVPYIILALAFAFRLGGGSTGAARRLAIAMLLLMLSGLEDLAFLLVNDNSGTPFAGIPDVWFWASHISVFIGHPPSKYEAFAFIVVHVALALLVLFAPARWFPSRSRSATSRDA